MRIKEENKWKAAFSIPESAFKPTVMFFGLINLVANFQAIMNDLLRNMIKAGDIAVFIDDVMVGTETEKKHNNIVKEILRRMAENNLFVKPKRHGRRLEKLYF